MPKPRLKGEAVKTSIRRALNRCSFTKELRTLEACHEKRFTVKKKRVKHKDLDVIIWSTHGEDLHQTHCDILAIWQHMQRFSFFLLLLQIYEKILGPNSGFRCY